MLARGGVLGRAFCEEPAVGSIEGVELAEGRAVFAQALKNLEWSVQGSAKGLFPGCENFLPVVAWVVLIQTATLSLYTGLFDTLPGLTRIVMKAQECQSSIWPLPTYGSDHETQS